MKNFFVIRGSTNEKVTYILQVTILAQNIIQNILANH